MGARPEEIRSAGAPAPVGPYAQAVAVGELVFASGQIPLDPATGELVAGEIEAQTERVLDNLAAVLAAAGSSLARVVPHHRLPDRPRALRAHERGLRAALHRRRRSRRAPRSRWRRSPAARPIEIDAIALRDAAPAIR